MKDLQFAIAKMSTKGQIVIPKHMRESFKDGEEFLLTQSGNRLILKSLKELSPKIKDDLKFAMRVEEAWKRYDQGKFKTVSAEKFLADMKKW